MWGFGGIMKFSEFLNQKQLNERVTPEFRDEFGKQETRRLMSNISNHRRAMDVRIGNKTEHFRNALDSDAPFDPNDPMTKFTRLNDDFVSKLRSSYSPFKLLNKIENFEGFLVKADEFSEVLDLLLMARQDLKIYLNVLTFYAFMVLLLIQLLHKDCVKFKMINLKK